MNYIEQINMFWLLDAEHLFNGNESRLYFYLLKLSNSLYWKNPVTNADGYTAGQVGISVNTLKTARNRLQQAGLIQFKPGGKGSRDKCIYCIIEADKVIDKVSKSDTLSAKSLTPYVAPGVPKADDIYKHKPEQTIPKENSSEPASPAPPKKRELKKKADGKEKETEPYWDLLVKTWFDFNQQKFGGQPSFADADPRYFKKIIERLKKRSAARNEIWNEILGPQKLLLFLKAAFSDPWLSKHFLLKTLLDQFDSIILGQRNKPNGAQINGSSPEPKSFQTEMQYLFDRFCEGELDERLISPDHYDKMVTRDVLPVGTMEKFEGTIPEKKLKAVLNYFQSLKTKNAEPV